MKKVLIFIGLCFLSVAAFCQTDAITIVWNQRIPYMYSEIGSIKGLTADVDIYAFKKAGINYVLKEVPSSRQLDMIKDNTERIASIGWFKNPERETFAQYSKPIYQDKPAVILVHISNTTITGNQNIMTLFGNKRIRLLVKDQYSYGSFIDQKIAEYKPNIVSTTGENINMIQMLNAKRADYMFIAPEEADELIKAAGLKMENFKLIQIVDIPVGNKRYLIFSKNISSDIITKINNGIDLYMKENNIQIE